jgi:site-specific recombinase XerD
MSTSAAVEVAMETLFAASLSVNTRDRYAGALKHWHGFEDWTGSRITAVTQEVLLLYVAHRFAHSTAGYSSVSIELSAIRDRTLQHGWPYPREDQLPRLRHLTRGYRRLRPKKHGSVAFPLSFMTNFINGLRGAPPSSRFHVVLIAAVSAYGFLTMSRVGHYTAKTATDPSPLSEANLKWHPSFASARAVTITFDNSKMNQFGKEEKKALVCSCSLGICGLHALILYLRLKHTRFGASRCRHSALFVQPNGAQLTASHVRKMCKTIAEAAGVDPEPFATHSLRSGGATALFERGTSLTAVEQLGGWTTGSVALRECYLQVSALKAATLAFAKKSKEHKTNGNY